jgi:hypothetical protein
LTSDVAWLADDARQGRRAGTEAGKLAADWLAQHLQQAGLAPAGERGYLQAFDVPLPAVDGGTSSVSLGDGRSFRDRAVEPLFCAEGARVTGRLAWGGFAVARPELGWDDVAHATKARTLAGRVVLIVRGLPAVGRAALTAASTAPDAGAKKSSSGWGGADSLFSKVMHAKRAGAAAVLIAPHPSQGEQPLPEFDAARSSQQSGLPALFVSLETARALEPAYDAMVASLEGPERVPVAFAPATASTVEVHADVRRPRGPAYNVLGRVAGVDGKRAILIGAHYDHLGHGGEGSLAAEGHGQIHNGADDNASGTAVVLELARQAARGPQPACDLIFALWSGEELGLLGSEHWARSPTVPLDRLVAKLNFDMVGRAESGQLALLGAGTAEAFAPAIERASKRAGVAVKVHASGQGVGGSDHQTFLKRQIPALHFFTGLHADYHRPSDDTERFEAGGAAGVVRLAQALHEELGALDARPAFVAVREPASAARAGAGWSVRFGAVPEYSFEGPGVLFAGVSPDSPAEKVGMLAGDVLVGLGDVEIARVEDLMYALQVSKPGDVVRVRWRRGESAMEARATLEARDAN